MHKARSTTALRAYEVAVGRKIMAVFNHRVPSLGCSIVVAGENFRPGIDRFWVSGLCRTCQVTDYTISVLSTHTARSHHLLSPRMKASKSSTVLKFFM